MKFCKLIFAVMMLGTVCLLAGACTENTERPARKQAPPDAVQAQPLEGPFDTILIAQAQFLYEDRGGQKVPTPGPAILTLKQKTPSGWRDLVLEDPQSNVFHKALVMKQADRNCILTIGAMQAALKLWERRDNAWQATLLWNPAFGGKWDRLRDVEVGDVTGNGKEEIVIATHDQGVVAVARQTDQGWNVREIDRTPGIFVHEIEIGDVDGDGLNEFFATPSRPNKARGGPQPGRVVMYKWNGATFTETTVDSSEKTHAKEILACRLDGSLQATLFSVFEAETRHEQGGLVRVEPVKIKEYVFDNGTVTSKVIVTLEDFQCRFLTAGDVDGDGRTELVAAAMKTGIWMLKRHDGAWGASIIDAQSSGYEHATCLADLDHDGLQEIYVASDDQREFRRYQWNGNGFAKTVLDVIPENRITWNLTTGRF